MNDEVSYERAINLYDDNIGSVGYVSHMGSDITVVNSARVSFGKNKTVLDEKDEKLIKYLIQHRHTSTLEHNNITFRFTVPLYVRSQHHRHRTWSYNEISRRCKGMEIYPRNILSSLWTSSSLVFFMYVSKSD